MTTENLFLAGEEYRMKTGENLLHLLNSLSKDHEISIKTNVADEIENVLSLKNGELQQWIK